MYHCAMSLVFWCQIRSSSLLRFSKCVELLIHASYSLPTFSLFAPDSKASSQFIYWNCLIKRYAVQHTTALPVKKVFKSKKNMRNHASGKDCSLKCSVVKNISFLYKLLTSTAVENTHCLYPHGQKYEARTFYAGFFIFELRKMKIFLG